MKHLNGKEVACLAASAPFIRQMVDHPPVWKLAFLREFGLPDPGDNVVIDWKLFYARAYPKSRVTSIGGENIGWVRIGVFNIESTRALLAEIFSSTKKATPEDTAHNLLGAWNPNLLAQHVTPGLWIAFAKVTAGATVPPGETPGEVIIELDVRHVNRFLETGIENLVYETYWAYSPVLTDGGFHAALFDRNSMHEAHNLCTINDWEVMELPSSWSGPPIMIKSYIGPHCVGMGVTLQLAGTTLCLNLLFIYLFNFFFFF